MDFYIDICMHICNEFNQQYELCGLFVIGGKGTRKQKRAREANQKGKEGRWESGIINELISHLQQNNPDL